jgi:hypothetical protein
MAYHVLIEASEPGARIEANGEYVGQTPVTLKIFGDRDGTFHDFGSYHYVIQALPIATNQFAQVRLFGTGRGWSHEDRIPERIYFDMTRPVPMYLLPPPNYYAPPPMYYYPPPYFYGPRVRLHVVPRPYPRVHRHR